MWGIYQKFEIAKRNCIDLYENMSPTYRKDHPKEEFGKECWNFWVVGSPTINMNWAKTSANIEPGLWNGGAVLKFSKIKGQWYLEGIVDWYYD